MIWLKRVLIILLAAVTLLLGIWIFRDNQQVVPFVLFGIELAHWPLVFWVLLAFLLGITAGGTLTLPATLYAKRRVRRLQQRLLAAEQQLAKQRVSGQ